MNMNTKTLKTRTAVLLPGRSGVYEGLYGLARKVKSGTTTVKYNKIKSLVEKDLVDRVILMEGSDQYTIDAVYKELKRVNRRVRYVLVDSREWPVDEQDRMVLLPGESIDRLVEEIERS
jgi:hypothetical protein